MQLQGNNSKDELVKDLLSGMPAKIIKIMEKNPYYITLYKNQGEDVYYVKGIDCIITDKEQLRYLSDSIVFENVSEKHNPELKQ